MSLPPQLAGSLGAPSLPPQLAGSLGAPSLSPLDWLVLFGTIVAIIGWGLYKERRVADSDTFMRGGRDLRWWTIGLGIMATQASAITFLSMPGQAFEDGMGFVQFYFGQPLAMVVLAAVIVPIYYRANVLTAYQFLETRFDRKTRQLTALLFLISRGLAAGISIYAPAIVLSAVLGWPLGATNLVIGGVVILYTLSGGARIVARTQTYQMVVMLFGMIAAAVVVWSQLPSGLSFDHALHVAGTLGRLRAVDTSLRFDTRYTLWSGLAGGLFVGLAYFGTDQSQVQRYLGGESLRASRLGLVLNGLIKIPMQALILFVGVLLFLFYQFNAPPPSFARGQWQEALAGNDVARAVEDAWPEALAKRRAALDAYLATLDTVQARGTASHTTSAAAELRAADGEVQALRGRAKAVLGPSLKDADYMFIDFVVRRFPPGLIGLLLAVILSASMSAVAAALTSLGSTSVVDFYRPSVRLDAGDAHYLRAARIFTALWGVVAIAFATLASRLDNLIQAVNILGSIFYGPMLGVFLVAFFLRSVRATPVFIATLVAQALVIVVFVFSDIGFLWYNVIGCVALILLALTLDRLSAAWR